VARISEALDRASKRLARPRDYKIGLLVPVQSEKITWFGGGVLKAMGQ